jgi:biopolymer transport protein ExbD
MAIRYHCPECDQLLSVATRMGGKSVTCPTCHAPHEVPLLDQPPFPPPSHSGSHLLTHGPANHGAASHGTEQNGGDDSLGHKPVHEEGFPEQSLPGTPAEAPHLLGGPSTPSWFSGDPLASRPHTWGDEEEDEGLALKPIERKSDELDLIPMVDCVFLLLVFYMITATYAMQKTIEMAPPNPDKKGAIQAASNPDDLAPTSIIVQIDARNRILVDDVPLATPADLTNALRAKMQGDHKEELVVEADPNAPVESVVLVADAAHELQFQRIRMGNTTGEGD